MGPRKQIIGGGPAAAPLGPPMIDAHALTSGVDVSTPAFEPHGGHYEYSP